MQCGCPECGALMAQVQRGLRSHCACPQCLSRCDACMGGRSRPVAAQLLKRDKAAGEPEGSVPAE